ncbi:UDP-galactopyranose/dTDP-fucopyranose mutase family protein [Dyella japonica]|uniref:UDP-galactopyranose mutase n=1 Tax=Dyella japonica A8 TaxID=1217721 RepID=A0A075K5I4_9GAMM|nr:UDP-galactopyranose mutase [Dyella japonica]AIF49380.1 UDP-galactopyranose mutase [Dyella japonica A8]
MPKKKIAIAGAGFSGAVITHQLSQAGYEIDVFDTRGHVAGNCHTERDADTGVMVHVYGPHIFHTSNEEVWRYVNEFDEFMPYINRVKANVGGKIYSMPINLHTINQFFGKALSPKEAAAFVTTLADESIADPQTFEEQALRFVGRDLYEAFFRGYTRKQWGMDPTELPASILKRLPLRFNYDDNYYNSRHQGIPKNGYTHIVEKMLDMPGVKLHLSTPFTREMVPSYDHVFYSGPIDKWFDFADGRLAYRTLDFEAHTDNGDFQGNAVINYCDESVPWTRISEHKHFAPWESHEKTVIFRERSRVCGEDDIPYYPIRLVAEMKQLASYVDLARQEQSVTFVGRLGTYRYLDMHVTIAEALDVSRRFLADPDGMPAFNVDM